jgi:hypothetical protein
VIEHTGVDLPNPSQGEVVRINDVAEVYERQVGALG